MKKLRFSIDINAPTKQVYSTMIQADSYKEWTAPFCAGSYYEGSWQAGSKIKFLSPEGSGMLAEIAENKADEYISIRHVGFIRDGIEDTESEEVLSWLPAYENYRFIQQGNTTRVEVDIDVIEQYEKYMNDTWPTALSVLKRLCEA